MQEIIRFSNSLGQLGITETIIIRSTQLYHRIYFELAPLARHADFASNAEGVTIYAHGPDVRVEIEPIA